MKQAVFTAEKVAAIAPARPACFAEQQQWVEYLLIAQNEDKNKPLQGGQYVLTYNFCQDCTTDHAAKMSAHGKCNPSVYRSQAKRPVRV